MLEQVKLRERLNGKKTHQTIAIETRHRSYLHRELYPLTVLPFTTYKSFNLKNQGFL